MKTLVAKLKTISTNPWLEIEIMLAKLTGQSRNQIAISKEPITQQVLIDLAKLVDQRLQGVPLAYLVGEREFFGLSFYVDNNCLIPRPESELIVELSLNYLRDKSSASGLDIATGSGCLCISICKSQRNISFDAIDISENALKVAAKNVAAHGLTDRINLINSSMENFNQTDKTYDLIISNPPYIPSQEISMLAKEVQNEPQIALDGGTDGFKYYPALANILRNNLTRGGYALIELHGYLGEESLKKMNALLADKDFTLIIHNDLANLPRVLAISRN